jgi:hypothetical protein
VPLHEKATGEAIGSLRLYEAAGDLTRRPPRGAAIDRLAVLYQDEEMMSAIPVEL